MMGRDEFMGLKKGDRVSFRDGKKIKTGEIMTVNKNKGRAWVSLEEISKGFHRAVNIRFDEMELI